MITQRTLRELCAPVPSVFTYPPIGSGLLHTCEAIERSAAAEPATVQSCRDAARRAVEERSPPGGPLSSPKKVLAHELEVLRLTVEMLRLLAEANKTPVAEQREALTVMLTARLYMMCGGQSGRPGAHKLACDSVAKAFGVPADDVATLVDKFFGAAGRLGLHDAHVNDRPAFMRLLRATMSATDDLLLGHTAWIGAAAAANDAEDYERRYQPEYGDLDG